MQSKAYLSILQWPEALDTSARVEALVAAAGLDPFLADQRIRKGTPLVAAVIDAGVRDDVLDVLRRRGVIAIAPTQAELDAVPPALRAKRLVRPDGAPDDMFMVEPWRGDPEGLICGTVTLIVRARLDRSTSRISDGTAQASLGSAAQTGGAGFLLNDGIGSGDSGTAAQASTTISHRHVLDLYTSDRRRVRCDSDKFNFDVLGRARGLTDFENSKLLADLLRSSCPRAVWDGGFSSFRAAPEILRSSSRAVGDTVITQRDDSPVFEFYSAWSYCLHEALRGG